MRRRAAAAAIAGPLTLVLTGCGAVHAVQDAIFGLNCTAVGLSESVTVDLTSVLAFEGGEYQVTMTLPGSKGTVTGIIDPHREGFLQIGTSADLNDDPVKVRVEARDTSGSVVYSGSGTQTPALDQPNGPRCDPENYSLSLQATDSGDLLPISRSEPVRDKQGRVSMWIDTRCGVEWLDDPYGVSGTWVRVQGNLDDGSGGPPAGWGVPLQRGWAAIDGDRLIYEDELGHREIFRPRVETDIYILCQP